ncbi:thiolase C-terminal domain-containing protein [Bradyrhizobium sp. USDA 4501]
MGTWIRPLPFTFIVLCQIEDLGFCAKGEGGHFIREKGIGPKPQAGSGAHAELGP